MQDSESQGVITDRGVLSICPAQGDDHVSKIEKLALTNMQITEKSVERLLKLMPALKSLDICGSKVDEASVEVLMALRPNCEVIYK